MMKVVTLFVLLILTVVGARSCGSSSPSSPFNPGNVARNGLNGVCANQQAVDAAGGGTPAGGVIAIPQAVRQELGGLTGSSGSSLSCTTTTLGATGDGN